MSKYIKYEDLDYKGDALVGQTNLFKRGAQWVLDRADKADSIDLVFCEECRECVEKGVGTDCPSGYGYLYCKRMKSVVDEDFYCGWGERR